MPSTSHVIQCYFCRLWGTDIPDTIFQFIKIFLPVSGNTKNVQRLIQCGAMVDLLDSSNKTAIQLACENNHVQVVRDLCVAGIGYIPFVCLSYSGYKKNS